MSKSVVGTVAIVGQGYVGLPLAMATSIAGWKTVGVDKSAKVVSSLNTGLSHIEDVKDDDLKRVVESGVYVASTDFSKVSSAQVCVICVPTPVDSQGNPDLSHLENAVISIAPHLENGTLLINESTSFPGTLKDLIIPLVRLHRKSGTDSLQFASAPERVDPGNTSWNMKSTPRLVSGIDEESKDKVLSFYNSICEKVILVSSPEVAEMAKLLENTFRQVNIALVNQLVPLCHALGIEIREVIEAAGSKPYGFMKFYPGAGVGGHCIPVDPLYLLWKARNMGVELPLVAEADQVNRSMPEYVVERLIAIARPQKGSYIGVMGVSYKPGVSDTRESPAEDVIKALTKKGFLPIWCDSLVHDFHGFEKYDQQELAGAIIVTNQADLPIKALSSAGVKILDCTGIFKGLPGIEQL
jgi:UDP-N-acetyl-D-glucosamine dehydrogenase